MYKDKDRGGRNKCHRIIIFLEIKYLVNSTLVTRLSTADFCNRHLERMTTKTKVKTLLILRQPRKPLFCLYSLPHPQPSFNLFLLL
jgi:hypothetical protein